MSRWLSVEQEEEEEIQHPNEFGQVRANIGRFGCWQIVALVSTVAVIMLCVIPSTVGSVSRGDGLEHLTELDEAGPPPALPALPTVPAIPGLPGGRKNEDLGFPIYFARNAGGLGTLSLYKTWLITFKGDAVGKRDEVAKRFGDQLLYSGMSLPVLVVKSMFSELKNNLKDCKPGEIEFAEQDGEMHAIPDKPDTSHHEGHNPRRLGKQSNPPSWGLDRVDHRVLPLDQSFEPKVDMKGGEGVHVYVLDTGVKTTHNDFGGRAVPTLETFSMRPKECGPTEHTCADDKNGHGTHCAGTVAGTKYGVAKKAIVHAVKVLSDNGAGSTATIELGLDFLINKGKKPAVASLSLGGPGRSTSSQRAINAVTASGITVVVAAGNENDDACDYSPAHVPSAVTVGSTTQQDYRSDFSNYGSCVDLFAPGSSITSAWYRNNRDNKAISGTSMACPHVSGAAALLLARSPSKTPQQLTEELIQHTTPDSVHDAKDGSPNKLLFVGNEGDAPTPAPQPPPSPGNCGWTVTTGTECEIDESCCLKSKSSGGKYAKDASCTISVGSKPGAIESDFFRTEAEYDILTVPLETGDHEFSGSVEIAGHLKSKGTVKWTADYSVQNQGFKICMKAAPTPPSGGCPANGWVPPPGVECDKNWVYGGRRRSRSEKKTYNGCATVDYYGNGWCPIGNWEHWVDCEKCIG